MKYVTTSIFIPILGTPLYKEYEDRLISQDVEDWGFLHLVVEPTNMSRTACYKEYDWLFIKLYNVARKTGLHSFMDLEFYKNMLVLYPADKQIIQEG